MEKITASEVAGLGIGALLFCATVAAPKVDSFISASQRRNLGMCKRCGDLKVLACSRCKGSGFVKSGFSFSAFDSIFESFGGDKTSARSTSCTNCQATGRISCPDCSK